MFCVPYYMMNGPLKMLDNMPVVLEVKLLGGSCLLWGGPLLLVDRAEAWAALMMVTADGACTTDTLSPNFSTNTT